MNAPTTATPWSSGRLDARSGEGQILFGRMYEDHAIESGAFRAGTRVFCIASAGCTAMALAGAHDVVAVDINPVQLAYAERRIAGESAAPGVVERFMSVGRALSPLIGWRPERVRAFLELDDVGAQAQFWRRHLDTLRFRGVIDGLLSLTALRTRYAKAYLDFLPPRLGAVMRARMSRCFARHANRTNPFARALLAGERDFGITHRLILCFLRHLSAADGPGGAHPSGPRRRGGFSRGRTCRQLRRIRPVQHPGRGGSGLCAPSLRRREARGGAGRRAGPAQLPRTLRRDCRQSRGR